MNVFHVLNVFYMLNMLHVLNLFSVLNAFSRINFFEVWSSRLIFFAGCMFLRTEILFIYLWLHIHVCWIHFWVELICRCWILQNLSCQNFFDLVRNQTTNKNYLLELTKGRSKVREKNMSRELALTLDLWKIFSEKYKPMRVWLWFVYKITENNYYLRLVVEFIQTQKRYQNKTSIEDYLPYQRRI